ncbi:MAG: copper chaperone, partial [Microbacterium sp.]
LPLIARNLRVVAQRSPRTRRTRATMEAATGWAAVWVAAGAVVSVGLVALVPVAPHIVLVVGATGAAVVWQFARIRTIALARCHRTLAPPLDRRAPMACRRYGVELGRDCLLVCWPAMVLMTVAGHQLLVVIALGWLSWRDIRLPHDRPGRPVAIAVLLGTGAFAAFAPLLPALQG